MNNDISSKEHAEEFIPVQIDSIKRFDRFHRTRCTYFRIEVDGESIAWPHYVSHYNKALLYAWGSWAVLLAPGEAVDAKGLFTSPELIEQTLASFEETEGLTLDLGNIWLPNKLLGLQDEDKGVRSGDVYRLSPLLFRQCYLFSANEITEDEWLSFCESNSDAIQPSPKETTAFRRWRREQIERSRKRYWHKDYADRRLPKKGAK